MAFDDTRWGFSKVIGRLNGKNLFDAWTLSSILSSIEYFDSWENDHSFLFPMLYPEKLNLFHRAILESKALDYKNSIISITDIPYLFNSINDATGQRVSLLDGNDDPNARLKRMLSTMAHQQIRLQESLFLDRIGRTYAFLYDIPTTFQDELKQRMGARFLDLEAVSKEKLGLSVLKISVKHRLKTHHYIVLTSLL